MLEYIIPIIVALIVVVWLFFNNIKVEHYKTCHYCGKVNYLGMDTNPEFERDHLKQYLCRWCKADLFLPFDKVILRNYKCPNCNYMLVVEYPKDMKRRRER